MIRSYKQGEEVHSNQGGEILGEAPCLTVGTVSGNKSGRYRFPVVSCRLAGRWTMPALPSPLTGHTTLSMQWRHSDSWNNSEPDSPHFQRPKFISSTLSHSVVKPLAASYNKGSSSCENRASVSKLGNATDDVLENSDRGSASSIWFSANDRKRSSDQHGTDLVSNKRERCGRDDESWKFRVVASSGCKSPSLLASDVIGTIDFNEDGSFFATGGIARKIRICSYEKMIDVDDEVRESSSDGESGLSTAEDDHRKSRRRMDSFTFRDPEHAAAGEICTPAKLSSLKWRPDGSDVIGCGDYDGVVMEWNIEHRHTVSEKYEHSGKRVWSLDYCKVTPTLSASSSADGTVRVWTRGMDKSVSVLRPDSGNSICSAEFSPVEDHLIAVASADANIYLYDLRYSDTPLLKLRGHDRAVSYVRFLGKDKLVSASIDSTLKLWDISAPLRDVIGPDDGLVVKPECDHGQTHPVRTFGAHTNARHFVGLSIHRGASILACGSETNEVFLYRDSSSLPLLTQKFPVRTTGQSGAEGHANGNPYVGAVCWREHGDKYALVAANSEGIVQVLEVVT